MKKKEAAAKRAKELERLRAIGSKGGQSTFKKHGTEHMKELSKKAAKARGWVEKK